MEKKYIVELTKAQLVTVMTALSVEMASGNYGEEIEADIMDALAALYGFKVKRT